MAPETLANGMTSHASDVWALGVIVYELAVLKKPEFLSRQHSNTIFIDGWRPDLSAIEDAFIRGILERIFVLNPEKRPTAGELASLLQASDISGDKQQAQGTAVEDKCMSLEAALNKANARITSLEKNLKVKSTKIETLEKQYKSLSKIVEQHQKQFAKVNEDLKQQLVQEPKIIPNPSSLKAIKQNQACKGDAVQQYSSTSPQSSWTPLMRAAATGDIKTARNHLPKNGRKSASGDAALILAARAGHEDVVELLDPTDKNGVTALMRAAERDDIEAARALMHLQKRRAAKCVMINGRSASHGTALMMAAACGHADVVELLVEYEGGMKDTTGQTALMYAVLNNKLGCAKLLLKRESGMQNHTGRSALMLATWYGNAKYVPLLLKKEGGMQSNNGWTALMNSAYKNKLDCVKLLKEKEKDMKTTREAQVKDDTQIYPSGLTALDIARLKGHYEIIEFLSN
ncbi:Kinase, NEK [Giardia duodenalis ATCC 50581]|nr:Kinase, NEK [Giardia intestinalis ATCC 50581]